MSTLPPGLDRLPSGKVRARYRDAAGRQHSKTFEGVRDAQRWLRAQRTAVDAGRHVDPHSGRVTFGDYADRWLAEQSLDPSTREVMLQRLRLHAYRALGPLQLRAITPSVIRAWQGGLTHLAPSYQRAIFINVSAALSAAVDDEMIGRNPCRVPSVRAPRVETRQVVPWTAAQVLAVTDALPEQYRTLTVLAAGLGLRQGEVFGLAVDDVDFLRGRVEVRRQVKIFSGNRLVYGLPKGGKTRTVPLAASVRDHLAAHLAAHSARDATLPWGHPDGQAVTVPLLTTSREGKALNRNHINAYVWKRALVAAGVQPSRENGMHALRHFFASALLDAGESIKAVSEYLGHTDPGFTLRTYTHLMPRSDERSRLAVDAALTPPSEPRARQDTTP